jgi:ABC-type dipeptide/oligopeptide/nickel transport system ATPase component
MVEPVIDARHALSVRDLVVDFVQDTGAVRALDGVSLDLHAGRVLGVVGESGCGKSVTARAIMRLIDRPGRIASGRVLLDPDTPEQQDLAALDPEGRAMRAVRGGRIGLIFQEPMTALSVHYTVGNQIIEAMRAHSDLSKAAARQRVVALLHEVGIPRPERRIDAYPFQLSGGLRQRVGIALALAADPQILIADEPTTALDVTTQAQILALLRRLQRTKGVALMLITHDMGVIAQMADDIAVMYLGRIVEVASVRNCLPHLVIPLPERCCVPCPISAPCPANGWPRSAARCRIPARARSAARFIRGVRKSSRGAAKRKRRRKSRPASKGRAVFTPRARHCHRMRRRPNECDRPQECA